MSQLSSFIGQNHFEQPPSVICLKADTYPFLFGRAFAQYYAKKIGVSFASKHMHADNHATIMAELQTSFLGATNCYWLGSFDDLSKNKQKEWQSFLSTYTGPHILIFFSSSFRLSGASIQTVELPHALHASSCDDVTNILGAKPLSFRSQLFRQTDTISLDEAFLLVQYDTVLGKSAQQFSTTWLPEMIVPELSLFALSQAFFDKKSSAFFRMWKKYASKYVAPFWVTFWSEQLWRAYHYIVMQKKGKPYEAKKVGFRLPFSFINRTWRKYSLDELQSYHSFLYDIDFHIKNGGTCYALDLFYAHIFLQSHS